LYECSQFVCDSPPLALNRNVSFDDFEFPFWLMGIGWWECSVFSVQCSVFSLSVSKYISLFNNNPFFIAVEFERAKMFSGAFIRGNEW
jgi:hypothetical protein